jgi:molybdopterin adenylyltransferase
VTVSDGVAAGVREDGSGEAVAERLAGLGLGISRAVVPDDEDRIAATLIDGCDRHPLIVTTGGTGLTPRDVTPQATARVIDYPVPGIAEAMRAAGRRSTPMADLSRAIAGVRGRSLVVNLPGSRRGALESLEVLEAVLPHALETLAGPFDHQGPAGAGRPDLPGGPSAPEGRG